jgi:hypothetical protein
MGYMIFFVRPGRLRKVVVPAAERIRLSSWTGRYILALAATLGLPAGSRTARRLPRCPSHWKILLNVGVEPPCRVPTKGESKKVQRQKLNETGVRYSFLLRAHFTFSQVLMFSRSF